MKKIWEKSWQNIYFHELNVSLSLIRRPKANFYREFYIKFFERYSSFSQLPENWRKSKFDTSQELHKIMQAPKRILSYGCGIGYVEFMLAKKMPNSFFDILDFSENSFKFISKDANMSCVLQIPDDSLYDVIYLTQVFYALSDAEILDLLKNLRNKLRSDGVFITFDTSSIPSENGIDLDFFHRFKKLVKDILRPFYIFIFSYKEYQFYGWYRTNKELVSLFSEAGYTLIETKSGASQAINIFRN